MITRTPSPSLARLFWPGVCPALHRRHQFHRSRTQQRPIELALVQQHLCKAKIVLRRAIESPAASEIQRGFSALDLFQTAGRDVVPLGETLLLSRVEHVRRVVHSKRLKNPIAEKPVVGLARHHFDDAGERVERHGSAVPSIGCTAELEGITGERGR